MCRMKGDVLQLLPVMESFGRDYAAAAAETLHQTVRPGFKNTSSLF